MIRHLKAEALKLRHTAFYGIHGGLAMVASILFLAYFAGSDAGALWQITAYVECVGIALPLVVSVVCGMAVEIETSSHLQVFLGSPCGKGKTFFYKNVWLLCCGLAAVMFAMLLFGGGYERVFHHSGIGLGGYVKTALLLWVGALPLYWEHLLLQFQYSKMVSLAVGVAECLLAALFLTGLGDGIWPLFPCSWGARLADLYVVTCLLPQNAASLGSWLMFLPVVGLFGIISVWLYQYEGRASHD